MARDSFTMDTPTEDGFYWMWQCNEEGQPIEEQPQVVLIQNKKYGIAYIDEWDMSQDYENQWSYFNDFNSAYNKLHFLFYGPFTPPKLIGNPTN